MSTLTETSLLPEFHSRLRAGRRKEAFDLIEPRLSAGDIHLILAYATAKLEEGDALAALSLLQQHEQHAKNSHFALVAGVAARALISQIGDWGRGAEGELVQFVEPIRNLV